MEFKPPEFMKPRRVDKEALSIINGLDARLEEARRKGETKLVVDHFTAFARISTNTRENISTNLRKKTKGSGNFMVAWRTGKITEEDVIEGMTGDLKMVYDYCVSHHLNPKIDYWTDGWGDSEGFKIVIDVIEL